MAYISVTFKVITPFYFFFLFGWTIFGIYLTSNNLWYVPFSFRFVVLLIVVLQFTLMIFFMIIGLIAGYFFITCKERAVYETYKTDKLEGERENLIKNEIEEEKLMLKREDDEPSSTKNIDNLGSISNRYAPEVKKRGCDDV